MGVSSCSMSTSNVLFETTTGTRMCELVAEQSVLRNLFCFLGTFTASKSHSKIGFHLMVGCYCQNEQLFNFIRDRFSIRLQWSLPLSLFAGHFCVCLLPCHLEILFPRNDARLYHGYGEWGVLFTLKIAKTDPWMLTIKTLLLSLPAVSFTRHLEDLPLFAWTFWSLVPPVTDKDESVS